MSFGSRSDSSLISVGFKIILTIHLCRSVRSSRCSSLISVGLIDQVMIIVISVGLLEHVMTLV